MKTSPGTLLQLIFPTMRWLERQALAEHFGGDDAVDESLDLHAPAGSVRQEQIEGRAVGAQRAGAEVVPVRQPGPRAEDRLGVYGVPTTELLEPLDLPRRNGPVLPRSDVEQQIAAMADHVGEDRDQIARRLVVRVLRLPTPCIADRHAELPPRVPRRLDGDVLLGRFVVAVAGQTAIDDRIGVGLEDRAADLLRLPLLGAVLPVAVEPPEIRLELSGEFADLALVEVEEAPPAGGIVPDLVARAVPCVTRVVLVAPVDEGEVGARLEAALAQFVEEGPQQIAACGRSRDDGERLVCVVPAATVTRRRTARGLLRTLDPTAPGPSSCPRAPRRRDAWS